MFIKIMSFLIILYTTHSSHMLDIKVTRVGPRIIAGEYFKVSLPFSV